MQLRRTHATQENRTDARSSMGMAPILLSCAAPAAPVCFFLSCAAPGTPVCFFLSCAAPAAPVGAPRIDSA